MKTQTSFWLLAAITTVSATVSSGYALAAVQASRDSNAIYAASRSVALLLVILAVIAIRSRPALITLAAVMILVQLFDIYPGALAHDSLKTFGPFATAFFNFAALIPLVRTHRSTHP